MLTYWLFYGHVRDHGPDNNWMANPKPIFNVDSSDVFWYFEILVMKCLILRLFSYDLELIYRTSERFRNDLNFTFFALAFAYTVIDESACDIIPAIIFMWGLPCMKMDAIFLKYLLFVAACALSDKCQFILDGQLIVYAIKQNFFFPLELIVCITVIFLIGLKLSLCIFFLSLVYGLINAQNSPVKAQHQYYLVLALTIFLKHVILPEFRFFDLFLNKLQQ